MTRARIYRKNSSLHPEVRAWLIYSGVRSPQLATCAMRSAITGNPARFMRKYCGYLPLSNGCAAQHAPAESRPILVPTVDDKRGTWVFQDVAHPFHRPIPALWLFVDRDV